MREGDRERQKDREAGKQRDRDPIFSRYFDPIYDFYATGKLHVPKDLCFDKFMAELRFWAVSRSRMDECCSPFTQYMVNMDTQQVCPPVRQLSSSLGNHIMGF